MEKAIDFKFAPNWKQFFKWHKTAKAKNIVIPWDEQKLKIQALFESTVPNVINWNKLWVDLVDWFNIVQAKKHEVLWSEQQRQIETLLINQASDLNKEYFFLAFLHKGKPEMDTQRMTYWEALRVKKQLEGDSNGVGGDESMDKITIVNINSLIK